MKTLLEAARFSRPYLARYWFRFLLGVILGVLFGISNGLSMGTVYIVLNRLDDPAHVKLVTERGREQHHARAAGLVDETEHTLKVRYDNFRAWIYYEIDSWLPLRGRDLNFQQCVGGFLFIPLGVLLRGILGYGSSYLLAWSGQRITSAVKVDAFRKLNSLSLDFFQRTSTGELIVRLESDSNAINTFLRLGLSDAVKEPVVILSLLATMFLIDWKFTFISLAFAPLVAVPTRIVMRRIKEIGRRDFANSSSQSSLTIETFQNVRILKAYGLEGVYAEIYQRNTQLANYLAVKVVQSRETLNPIVQTLGAMGISAVLLYAVWIHSSFSTIASFIASLFLLNGSFRKLSTLGVYVSNMQLALERLMDLFKMQPTVREAEHPVAFTQFQKEIVFRGVAFSYGDGPVLQDINLVVRRGERVGLVGESGSGKSSLLNLVYRFYDVSGGEILIDGVPIQKLSLADLREHMALVSQEVLLFNATVAENIAYGRQGATRAEIEAAAREAYAHDFILTLPKGYDTPLGERGLRLSGGQRQRIAIARAFIRNAPILVLDEATAALDSQSEAEVQKAIDHLAENRTVLCVAHRLSTLRSMDRIIVLDKGRIVEEGGFEDLLNTRGAFSAMAARQSIFPKAA